MTRLALDPTRSARTSIEAPWLPERLAGEGRVSLWPSPDRLRLQRVLSGVPTGSVLSRIDYPSPCARPPADRLQRFFAWVETLPPLPRLSDAALERERLY